MRQPHIPGVAVGGPWRRGRILIRAQGFVDGNQRRGAIEDIAAGELVRTAAIGAIKIFLCRMCVSEVPWPVAVIDLRAPAVAIIALVLAETVLQLTADPVRFRCKIDDGIGD